MAKPSYTQDCIQQAAYTSVTLQLKTFHAATACSKRCIESLEESSKVQRDKETFTNEKKHLLRPTNEFDQSIHSRALEACFIQLKLSSRSILAYACSIQAHGYPATAFFRNKADGLQGIGGLLHNFLKDFGPCLIKKYEPKAIVVFSAHWESRPGWPISVTDYGKDQPLLYDYYGFPPECYEAKWHSNGSSEISDQVIECLTKAGIEARKTTTKEPRGQDGRKGPSSGLDHGVFIPFMIMFPEGKNTTFSIPIVQVSMDGSLDPFENYKLGQSLSLLRKQGILVLCGGLTVHNLEDFREFSQHTASESVKTFDDSIIPAALENDSYKRLKNLVNLTETPGFRRAHPRADHFAPIWVAAGAGDGEGETRILCDLHGCKTIAFGVL
ncbi:hypothetical protein O181_034598 [Austropuccinia psidii MF-1]|uniref:Extradiol ring-cleavage dioxygenase class III enzyme subunit B domain-containing protein n=1 Tax=Austropuccinia psidii MF-1 TaxID=1389203 RepID=A0A9Q3D3T4_9BASI|nr:hypothetical protein [Austropuccinia psidii MF-1]